MVNGCSIEEVVIDPHYEVKHPDIDDDLILKLVRQLDGKEFEPQAHHDSWEFYVLDRIEYRGKQYRLIWCQQELSPLPWVINCFRR